jgi:transposase
MGSARSSAGVAGLCSGQNESAGKRKSSRLRKGSPWLKTLMVQCSWAPLEEGQLLQSAVQPPAPQARREESDPRCGSFDAHRSLPHVEGRHSTPGPRRQSLRSPLLEIKARRLAAQIAKLGYQVELRPLPEAA